MWSFPFLRIIALILILSATQIAYAEQILKVAAAADLKFVLDSLVQKYQDKNPGESIEVTYGSSGVLTTQLVHQAPFDIFLSADSSFAKTLVDAGQVDPEDVFQYAIGRIVLWVPNDSEINLEKRGMQALVHPEVDKIAIANPKHAPYGKIAEAAIHHAGLYEKVKGKLVLGENVMQAAQFVETEAAEIGILALGLVQSPEMRKKGRYWKIPEALYPKLLQAGMILKKAKNRELALKWKAFLLSSEGQSLFKFYGISLPGK